MQPRADTGQSRPELLEPGHTGEEERRRGEEGGYRRRGEEGGYRRTGGEERREVRGGQEERRSEEHTSELQSH